MIATYPLRRDLWQELFDKLTDTDVAEFNQAYGASYTRKEIAYIIPTLARLDDLLLGYYGSEIAFRTRFLKATWTQEFVIVEVEVTYKPVINWN